MSIATSGMADAQREMRLAHFSGAPAIFASALAWLVAGVVALQVSTPGAIVSLLAGGALIQPVGIALSRALGRTGTPSAGNPLSRLALEAAAWLVLCLPITYAVSQYKVHWFFPAMLVLMSGRYLTYRTVYGLRLYWTMGGVLALVAYLLAGADAAPSISAFVVAAIELFFGAGVCVMEARSSHSLAS